jgi:beta-lactamase class A
VVRLPLTTIVVAALYLAGADPAAAEPPDLSPLEATLNRIATASRGKIGLGLIHLESGRHITIRGHERFPMASVVKLPIALELLRRVADRTLSLDREVWLDASDIRPCCSLSRRHPVGGIAKSVRELLELMLIESDNTAADSVLEIVGGPSAVERRLRALGFHNINVNRSEGQLLLDMAGVVAPPPEQWTLELQRRLVAEVSKEALNEGRAEYLRDSRDTATPYEMAAFVGRLQLGDLLPRSQTGLLLGLMARSSTGSRRLKSRLPAETRVAHKTGTTSIVINDVGIIHLPADSVIRGRLAVAVFVTGGSSIAAMERTVAQVGAAAFEFFSGKRIPEPPRRTRRRRR